MALITSKGMYGLAAIYELSQKIDDKPMQVREISRNANIPQNYLEQLLGKLRKAGFIKSIRGPKGGYILSKSPEDIIVRDILYVLEDNLSVVDMDSSNTALGLFYQDVEDRIKAIFELSLTELKEYEETYNACLHYSI